MFQNDAKHMYIAFNFHITNLVPHTACLCEEYFLDVLMKEYILHVKLWRWLYMVIGECHKSWSLKNKQDVSRGSDWAV